jgi:ParB-like chromosome segregation protein Spo0J
MISHPAASLFPMMSEEELAALTADIAAHGQREPILIDLEGQVVDGRNRWLACEALGLTPVTRVMPDTDSVVTGVVSLNLHRRHLTPSQKAGVAVAIEGQLAVEARERALANLRRGGVAPGVEIFPPRGKARDRASALVGVNGRYVSDAERIAARAPALLEQVRDGTITIGDAKRALKARDRAEHVEQAARGALPPSVTLIEDRLEDAALEPESFDLVLTDPPYGVSAPDISRSSGRLIRDFGEWDHGDMPINMWAARIAAAMKPGASIYLFTSPPLLADWRNALMAAGLTWRQAFIGTRPTPRRVCARAITPTLAS